MMKGMFQGLKCVMGEIPNGMKILTNYRQGETCCVGLFINAGSRYERQDNNGIAHFLEHMYFKGTENRTMNDIEMLCEHTGTLLSAHTSREYTCYSAHGTKDNLELGVDILSDMILNPLMDSTDIKNERNTVLREHEYVNSIVEEYFFDVLHELAFGEHPLGYPILGPIKNIKKKITKRKMNSFRNQFYNSHNMILVGVGEVDEEEFASIGEKYFSSVPNNNNHELVDRGTPQIIQGAERIVPLEEESGMVNSAIAFQGPGFERMEDLTILNLIQGSMGYYDVFEKNNFVAPLTQYMLDLDETLRLFYPFAMPYQDCSMFGIKTANESVGTHELIERLVAKTQEGSVETFIMDEESLEAAKHFFALQLLFFLENKLPDAMEDYGRNFLFTKEMYDPEQTLDFVKEVTMDDLRMFLEEFVVGVKPVVLHCGDRAKIL